MDFIRHSIESHDRQIGELTDRLATLGQNINKLVEVSNRDAVDIRALMHIAEAHEKRLERLEQGRPE